MKTRNANITVIAVLIIAVVISLVFIYLMYLDGYSIGIPITMEKTGQFGDYFGGVIGTIFSAAAFWLLYLTLKQQLRAEVKNNFDTQFSKMLLLNQQNLDRMTFDASKLLPNTDKLYIEPRVYEGKDVFQIFYYQFITCKNDLMPLLGKASKIYTKEYERQIKNLPIVRDREIPIYQLARIDICYSIVFWGVGSEGVSILRSLFKNRYRDAIIEKVINFISLKPAFDKRINRKWSYFDSCSIRNLLAHVNDIYEWRERHKHEGYAPSYPEISTGYRSDFVRYYTGFHQMLGHYFRQYYQLVKFVDGNRDLTESQKYNFVKTIRSQMSNYEQTVFFLNSLSSLGRVWEIDPEKTDNKGEHSNLITHYKLIKNVPSDILFGIRLKDYYPDIDFEIFG